MERLIVKSIITKKNLYVMLTSVVVLLIMMFVTIYKWFTIHLYQPVEVMFEVGILVVCIARISAKYTYEMNNKFLLIKKESWRGVQRMEVFYRDIIGIYRYQPKLLGMISFRHTYRLHSALDGRNVLTIAYIAHNCKGKRETRRIYFKPNEELLTALQRKLPQKVFISEQKVVLQNLNQS